MSARRGTEKRAMPEAVLVRMDEATYDAVTRAAEAAGVTAAAYLRTLAADAVKTNPPPRPRRAPPRLSDPQVARLAQVATTLAMVVGLMTQIAAALRKAGISDWHAKAEAALTDLRHCAAMLQEIIGGRR